MDELPRKEAQIAGHCTGPSSLAGIAGRSRGVPRRFPTWLGCRHELGRHLRRPVISVVAVSEEPVLNVVLVANVVMNALARIVLLGKLVKVALRNHRLLAPTDSDKIENNWI